MSWSFSWQGKAQEYDPSLVQIGGSVTQRAHAQAMARAAFDAIAEWPPEQYLAVSAYGHAADDGGNAALNIAAYKPSPVEDQLTAQQPVSVLQSGVPTGNPATGTAASVQRPAGDPGAASSPSAAQAAPSETPVDSSLPAGPSETAG